MAPSSQNIDEIMEPKNQFRLANAVQAWRSQFQSQSSIAADDLDELEVHLRDSFDELVELGLREEEAFWVARQRMGQPASLGSEFRKLHPSRLWTSRVCWMLVGFLSFRLVGELASVLSKTVAMVSSMMGLASGWSNSLGVILLLLPWVIFVGYLYRRCQGLDGAQSIPLSWIFDKKPVLSAMLVALVFGSIFASGQGVTIIYYRTLSTLSGPELSSFQLTQAMTGLGLSCFLLVGGTLAIHRLRRRSV